MLTFGEAITSALRFRQNPGSDLIGTDVELRAKAAYFGTLIAKRAYTLAPYWWRNGDGTVSVSAGVGTMPADFGTMGTQGQVYVQGQPILVNYLPPDDLKALIKANASIATIPYYWTLSGKTVAGLAQILTYPVATCTLELKAYVRRCPDLIDFPTPPTTADGGGAGNLNGTGYLWSVTYVHPFGETEGGTLSVTALSLASRTAALTFIPVSPIRAVTGRKIYRNASGGIQLKLAGTISDNLTASFTDNLADGSLGVNVPTPASGAVSGLELFPEDFHEEIFVEGIVNQFLRAHGDLREQTFTKEWEGRVKAMWANQKQGQNVPQGMPPFGRGGGSSRRPRAMA